MAKHGGRDRAMAVGDEVRQHPRDGPKAAGMQFHEVS
jgi:hypothetical protein